MITRFHSILAKEMEAFLSYKKVMGFRYERAKWTLLNFDRHLRSLKPAVSGRLPWETIISGWLARYPGRKAVTVSSDLRVLRQFCLYRRRKDPRAFVPEVDWAPADRESHFVPYIFSASDIRRMLKASKRLSRSRRYNRCLRLQLLVLYCTGLRFGEAARLRMADLDLRRRLLWIRQSKGRTRLVPFRGDLAREFQRYLKERPPEKLTPLTPVFLNRHGRAHSTQTISYGLSKLLWKCGLKTLPGRQGPRPYDVRHTFAVHRLTRWYRQSLDLNQRLPWLSVYMGHADILGTETYLNATPELLALVAHRFEARFRRRSRYS